jgi:hypothetical protein
METIQTSKKERHACTSQGAGRQQTSRQKWYSFHFMLWSALIATCFVTACTTSQQADSNNTSPAVANIQLSAELNASPTGQATLTWRPSANGTGTLTVNISATGLAPNSTHPEHIHAGTCATNPMGPIIYQLRPLVADAHGNAQQQTIITDVKNGIPATGWFVNIHNGPTLNASVALALNQARTIACGDVVNPQGKQAVQLTLQSMKGLDGDVHGTASLQLGYTQGLGDHLLLHLTASGLAPGSTHWISLRQGTCQQQGPMTDMPLLQQAITSGRDGTVAATIAVANPDVVKSILDITHFSAQWYIMIHEAAQMNELKTQTGFDPLACGNITIR